MGPGKSLSVYVGQGDFEKACTVILEITVAWPTDTGRVQGPAAKRRSFMLPSR